MRSLLHLLIVLSIFPSCTPDSQPVDWSPTDAELLGEWILCNSPTMSRSLPVSAPTKGTSSLLLTSNHVAKLKNILVEEVSLPAGSKIYQYRPTLRNAEDSWEVQKSQGLWAVTIKLPTQVIALIVKNRSGDGIELSYQPDPERDPFIYVRREKTNNQ